MVVSAASISHLLNLGPASKADLEIAYKELVENISQHPDYAKALAAVKNIAPVIVLEDETPAAAPAKTENNTKQ